MRLVVQRVVQAAVTSARDGLPTETADIGKGLCVLVGFERSDTLADCEAMAKQLFKLRVFPEDPTAESCARSNAVNVLLGKKDVLLVSQFTLNATLKSGRPSYHRAMDPQDAKQMFHEFIELCKQKMGTDAGVVKNGIFGSWMQVHIVNDGPFTICLTCADGKCSTW